jgi:hypothetical protein
MDGDLTARPRRPTHPLLSIDKYSSNSYYPLAPQIATIQPNLLQIIGITLVMYLKDPQKARRRAASLSSRNPSVSLLFPVRLLKPLPFIFPFSLFPCDFKRVTVLPCRLTLAFVLPFLRLVTSSVLSRHRADSHSFLFPLSFPLISSASCPRLRQPPSS